MPVMQRIKRGQLMDQLTIIKSISPDRVCKTYNQDGDELKKSVIANINEGEGITVEAPDAAKMMKILKSVTERNDLVLCAGVWHNAQIGQKFKVMSEKALCELVGGRLGEVSGGIIKHGDELVSARLKRGIDNSCWMLLDADNPDGIPDEWARMTIAERLELWEPFVQGITKCERIELCGSSARVVRDGEAAGNATHAWIRVSDPDKISVLRSYIRVKMVLHGASFTFKKMSQIEDGKVVGNEARSVFDLAVFDTGRLVFCAKPEVNADGYTVEDANIQLFNEGAGPLDISWVELPTPREMEDLRNITGVKMSIKRENNSVVTYSEGELTADTEVEVRGITRRLEDWAGDMGAGDKLRCEAPFRSSQSEAAFIRIGDDGQPFIYDIGNSTTYLMRREIQKYNPESDFDDFGFEPVKQDDAYQAPASLQSNLEQPVNGFDDWVFLTRRNVFRNKFTGEECSTQSFNLAFTRDVPLIEVDTPNGGTRSVRPAATKYVMDYLEGEAVYDTLYLPQEAQNGMVFEHDSVRYVNSYMPLKVPHSDPEWQNSNAWRLCENHIRNILPNDWEVVLQWMAYNVQNAGKKVLWAPIIKGIQGDGKTTLGAMIGAAMGQSNVRMISPEETKSDFNGWAEGACVGILEEIRIKGHNRHDVMNKLKPLITNEKISVVRKGQDGRNIPNCTNYLALTNFEDALVLDDEDRRWGVFFTRFSTREELLSATNDKYWDELYKAIHNHPSVLRGWLMNYDVSEFVPTRAPAVTEAKSRMIEAARSEEYIIVKEMIDLAGYGVSEKIIATDCMNNLIRQTGNKQINSRALSKAIEELGFARVEKPIKWRGKSRRLYVSKYSDLVLHGDDGAALRDALDATVEDDFVEFPAASVVRFDDFK
jgi:Pyruvate/2-oxoacid:ferredoxin oxidoreductase gamma subunit